jgi:hypothetical protein
MQVSHVKGFLAMYLIGQNVFLLNRLDSDDVE